MLIALASCAAFGQTKFKKSQPDEKVKQELLKLERQWIEAFGNFDRATLERVMTDVSSPTTPTEQ